MRIIEADDYGAGKLVTVLKGPFREYELPPPFAMMSPGGNQRDEDTSMHGRVFTIECYDPPWIILKPLDGSGDPPIIRNIGPLTMVPRGIAAPTACCCDVRTMTLAEVSDEYVEMFKQHFCQRELMQLPGGSDPMAAMLSAFGEAADELCSWEQKGDDDGGESAKESDDQSGEASPA